MKKKNLEKRVVCVNALISGSNVPKGEKEEPGLVGTYLHPCMTKLSYVTKEEIERLRKYQKK